MTVKELRKILEEVEKTHPNAVINSDDGTGWASDAVYIDYSMLDDDEPTLGIFA